MPLRLFEKDVYYYFEKNGFKCLTNFTKAQEHMTIEDTDGYRYSLRYCSLVDSIENKKLSRFNKYNMDSFYNMELWISNNKKDYLLIGGEYISSKEKTFLLRCSFCDEKWLDSSESILAGQGCPFCAGKRISESNNLEFHFPELIEEWDYRKNKMFPSNYFPKSGKFVWWVCPLCDNSYDAPIASRTSAKSSCPKCRESKGEKSISNWLICNGIENIPEFKFDGCRDKRKLPFDFYLPDYNLCIEYDGEQHYSVRTNFFGGNDKFKQLKRRDKIKTKYRKDNNIYLLRIPYWDFNNIEKILTKTLFL